MSSFATRVKAWYEQGRWTEQMVRNAYAKGRLTADELAEILGTSDGGSIDYAAMTKHELVELATMRGITAYESWTKAAIIAALESADASA